jgi:hypothetical protein
MMLKDRLLARWQIEDHMIRNLKRSWWLGALVAGFAIAVIATVQATITIAGTVIQATSVKPLTSREPRLNRPPSFEERWQTALSTNWQGLPMAISTHQ